MWKEADEFARAMPDYLKYDETINSVEAYREYVIKHKPWASWKTQSRKPEWWNESREILNHAA
jgi:hypothetical protein